MSLQPWNEEDTLALIEWAANESVVAIKARQYADAEILQRGVAAIIGLGQIAMTNDPRLNKWLDFRLSEISYPLREKRIFGSIVEVQRSRVINSLVLLTKFFESLPDTVTIGEKLVLPEPFDENGVFW